MTDHTAGKLLRIDPRTNRVTGRVALSGADWVTGYGGSLYVSQETNVVTRVDARTLKVLGRGRCRATRSARRSSAASCGSRASTRTPSRSSTVDDEGREDAAVGGRPIVVLPVDGHAWVSLSTGTAISRL